MGRVAAPGAVVGGSGVEQGAARSCPARVAGPPSGAFSGRVAPCGACGRVGSRAGAGGPVARGRAVVGVEWWEEVGGTG
ncbi:hypothetical protein GCM10010428_42270 [Actinosynnema pretiosum subsp. pretiosum]